MTPRPTDPERGRTLRDFLQEAGYTERDVARRADIRRPPAPQQRAEGGVLDATRSLDALGVLIRLFVLGLTVPTDAVERAIPVAVLGAMGECGLLGPDADGYRPQALIAPYRGVYIVSDTYQRLAEGAPDFVLGIGAVVDRLADFTMRRTVGRVLDLCGGNGVHGLLAARHAEDVVSSDLNPRATALARFNVWLNGCPNMTCVTGDTFEPVAGERFDLILCNPPFVVAPQRELLYRDGGMPLDGYVEKIVRETPARLNDGGCAQLLGEWVGKEETDWTGRLAPWLTSNGCDAWVLKDYSEPVLRYAEVRLRETLPAPPEHDRDFVARWMDFYRAQGVERIHGGLLLLRRRTGETWRRLEELDGTPPRPFGAAIAAGLAARDFVAAHADDVGMLATSPVLAPGVELVTVHERRGAGWELDRVTLRQTDGLLRRIRLDPAIAEFLGRFDGETPVRAHIERLATEVSATPERVQTEAVGLVRRMLELGFLAPSAGDT